MLIFSAFTPHSPLLLPTVNKDQAHVLAKTTEAMKELADELYATHPDTILLISEHPTTYTEAFSINLSDPYKFELSDFGVLKVDQTFHPDMLVIDRLQRSLRNSERPLTLTTDQELHYASAVPLILLTEKLDHVKLVPISYSDLSAKDHFQFGQSLKDIVMESEKRIAVIASGDMSHALTSDSPAGFHKDGKIFDEKIQELIAQKNTAGLLSLDKEMVNNAQQTSYRPLSILFGMLERVSVTPQILNYEAPFGVGYLVAHFIQK